MFVNTGIVLALVAPFTAVGAIRATVSFPGRVSGRDALMSGKGTVYQQGGTAGSCGSFHSDDDPVAALGTIWLPMSCDKNIAITNLGGSDGIGGVGNTAKATVLDTCLSCDTGDVDMSVGIWNLLTNNASFGTINVDWTWA